MSTTSKMIVSKSRRPLALCILSLCLAVPALCAADSHANPTARMSSIIIPPELPFPPPPPAQERMSSIIVPPELPFPPPPPALSQGTTAMEQTA